MTTTFHVTERFGPQQAATHEGFLVVHDVPLARTGTQLYSDREVPVRGDASGRVLIMRDEAEVFRPQTIASLQGKPITIDHPDEDVTPANWRDLAVGHVVNPRRGTGRLSHLLLGDLFVTCPRAIRAIRDGSLRGLSVGYESDYEDHGDGRGAQKNIVANHLALVEDGRCGPICRIGDSMPHGMTRDACTCHECGAVEETANRAAAISEPEVRKTADSISPKLRRNRVRVHLHL